MERKLSAILAADVVGYAASMERDEAGTFDRLTRSRRDLVEPEVAKFHGRIFKLMGDGLLAEFSSVVEAVECAANIQRGMAELNALVTEAERIDIRVGINLGEVIVDGDDLYGEGVNIAARLESLAEPGGICVSEKVVNEVEKKLAFEFVPMGKQRVKNIAEPIAAFRVRLDTPRRVRRARPAFIGQRMALTAFAMVVVIAGALLAYWSATSNTPHEMPAVAVLPFANYGGDDATGRLADGLTEDMITDLSRFADFEVIARNSTEVYKDKPVDIRDVAKALHVSYVLEGSIQHQHGRVRINAQLINATTNTHLWSNRWDRPDEDIFAVQAEIARDVANQLGGGVGLISKAELGAARRKPPDSLNAYQLYLLGNEKLTEGNSDSLTQAIPLLLQAVDLDPSLARAWAGLFFGYNVLAFSGVDPEKNRPLATDAAQRAVKADPNDPNAHIALGSSFGLSGDFERAKAEFETALRLAPGSAEMLIQYSSWAATLGMAKQGGEMADQAIRPDPNYAPWAAGRLSYAYFAADRYEGALRVLDRAPPDTYSPDNWVERPCALAALGRRDEATDWRDRALKINPDVTIEGWSNELGYSDEERQRWVRTMRLAGFPICAKPEALAGISNPIRQPECASQ